MSGKSGGKKLELLAVNVGIPQEVEINGKKVSTAIQKKSIVGPVYIRKEGPVGDKPAVHPEAVYAITSDHYDYWANELGEDRSKWEWGLFGENLTISGIDETGLRIGDKLAVGEEVMLQVVCTRIPCSKLSWRLGQSDEFLRRFSLSGKTGFYLKVLSEGHIKAGDNIEHIPHDIKAITLSELARFFVTIDEATEDRLYHVLSHEHLGLSGLSKINRRLATIKDLSLMKKGRWSGWREFIVDEIVGEACEIKSFWLKPKDGEVIAGYRPGQFLTCRVSIDSQEVLIRTWTISDFDPMHHRYRITVKKIPNGKTSFHLHEELKRGAIIEVKPPNGSFVLDRSTHEPIVLISAGIGITPMISMFKGHIKRELHPLPYLYFVHAVQDGQAHTFHQELVDAASELKNFKMLRYYSKPRPQDTIGQDYDIKGHFNIRDLDALMEGVKTYWGNRWHEWPKQSGLFYLCGPAGFQESVKEQLIKWGVKGSHIFVESFNPLSGSPTGIKAESSRVTFSKSGICVDWSEDEDLTLLELAEKCGIKAPNACRMGVCETCESVLKKGCVYYDHGHLANRSEQTVLTCCSKPGAEEIEIEL